ncbi:HD-GYP domain-containing protein [Niallia sp. Sow4_A1]|uniref:HD-GYP domain-containing protein n=1 Tax=Niallia sp. Sow4_A1 TaxID=3438793 RepID=UPI003F9880A1
MKRESEIIEIQSDLKSNLRPFILKPLVLVENRILSVLMLVILFFSVVYVDRIFYHDRSIVGAYILLVLISSLFLKHIISMLLFNGFVVLMWYQNSLKGFPTEQIELFTLTWIVCFLITFVVRELINKNTQLKESQLMTIFTLAKMIDMRDPYTAYHSKNVAFYSREIAKEMKLPKKVWKQLYTGGLLHDIGKIGVADSIINKPGKLTDEEFEIIKQHTTLGYDLMKNIPRFKKIGILDMVLYHHERYDGKGYPEGLKGNEIPLVARIMAVADTFDAMTTNRVYRGKRNIDEAIKEIENNKEKQFDPIVVDAFLKAATSGKFIKKY